MRMKWQRNFSFEFQLAVAASKILLQINKSIGGSFLAPLRVQAHAGSRL